MTEHLHVALRLAVIVALLAIRGNALAAPQKGTVPDAERLADGIATQQADSETPGAPAVRDKPSAKAGTVSVLDVAAKLALLVLAVYGISYGLKVAQRSGFTVRSATHAAAQRRLRAVEELPLRAGVALHLVEVDGQTLVVATAPGGVVSVVMETGSEPAASVEGAAATPPEPGLVGGMSLLREDADWQARRDTLIRALSSRAT